AARGRTRRRAGRGGAGSCTAVGGDVLPMNTALPARDPAWLGRVFWIGAALALLWPMLVATEFRPWILFSAESRGPTLRFLSAFVPPAMGADFLALVAREPWRTVAIATTGITLALVIAVPATLMSTRVLSVSAL